MAYIVAVCIGFAFLDLSFCRLTKLEKNFFAFQRLIDENLCDEILLSFEARHQNLSILVCVRVPIDGIYFVVVAVAKGSI